MREIDYNIICIPLFKPERAGFGEQEIILVWPNVIFLKRHRHKHRKFSFLIIYIRVLQLHQIDSEFLHLCTGSPMPIKHAYGIQVPKPDVGQMASFQGHDTHTGGVDYICH